MKSFPVCPSTRWLLLVLLTLCGTAAAAADATLVRTRPLSELVIYPQRSAPATVLSLNDARLSAEIGGRILRLPVKVGDRVAAGDVLVELDCRDHRLALRQAQAQLDEAVARRELAERQLKRARSLLARKNISADQFDQRETEERVARSTVATAQVARDQAQLAVERCKVRAPFAGLVTARLAAEGEHAAPGTPLVQVLDRQRLEVSAQVPLNTVDGLRAAESYWLQTSRRRYPLHLRELLPAVNVQARNSEARFTFADADERALPGTAGRVVWRSAVAHLPAELLSRRGDALGVFVANSSTARFVPLPQAHEGMPAPVDLPADTQIVTEGRYGLSDGSAVRVQP